MPAETSLWLNLIDDHVNVLLISEKRSELQSLLQQAKIEGKYLYSEYSKYNFNIDRHVKYNNRHLAPSKIGCGCTYCEKRHEYAKLKLELHRKIKSFDRYLDYGFPNIKNSTHEVLTEFNKEREEYLSKINSAKKELKEIKYVLFSLGFTNIDKGK